MNLGVEQGKTADGPRRCKEQLSDHVDFKFLFEGVRGGCQ